MKLIRDTVTRRASLKALTGVAACSFASAARTKPLNFVFILADDLGWADLACYGNKYHETPNLDRLAREGVRFTNAYAAAPVCSPSRAALMTGKYPARLGLTNYLPGKHPLPYSKLIGVECIQQLALEETTIAESLAPASYVSANIGKWHLGPAPFLPQNQGFAVNVGGSDSGMPTSFFFPKWQNNPPVQARDGEYLTDVLTDRAVSFIESNHARPFFLYLPHYAVHIPIEAKQELVEKYRRKGPPGIGKHDAAYAAMLQSVDESVGRVLKTLDDLSLRQQTVVMFSSDNGGLAAPEWQREPVTSNAPLREGKGHLYEGGLRVPLIAAGPGVRVGAVEHAPVCGIDLLPTLRELAGLEPARPAGIDGVSFAKLFETGSPGKERDLFWHYPHYSNQGGKPGSAMRRGRYKLIEFAEDHRLELYDLSEDPGERRNLAAIIPDQARSLQKALTAWKHSVDAKEPAPNPNYDPARAEEGYAWNRPSGASQH